MIRDLDEMRAFKTSEAKLLTRINEGGAVEQLIFEPILRQLRERHARYIRGDATTQLALVGLEGQRSDLICMDETMTLGPPGVLRSADIVGALDRLRDSTKEGDS